MNFDSLNIILTIAAFIVGIMLLTGHGDIFLKVIQGGGDTKFQMYMNLISTWGIVMPLSFLAALYHVCRHSDDVWPRSQKH